MSFRLHTLLLFFLASALLSMAASDLLIVGGGISGLSAAAEGARLGLRVTVVDRHSIYGGTAVIAYGVAIVGSPFQEQQGIKDSPELAFQDFVRWGEDPDQGWAYFYAQQSKVELFDWFTSRGVQYDKVVKPSGNSVARFHHPRGGVVSLVQALYREIHDLGGVEFIMNTDVTGLVLDQGRVTGVQVRNYRSGISQTIPAKYVLLSTGGFQNNPELVRKFWPANLGKPERILLGSGVEATGSGLDLARSAGGAVAYLDRQWNYSPGIPLADGPTGSRGVFVNVEGPIWVNAQGKRFINEAGDKRARLAALTKQNPAKAWMIFDGDFLPSFEITHPVFNTEPTKSNLLSQPGIMFEAATIEELAAKAGLPPADLAASVERYNSGLQSGQDDVGRLKRASSKPIRIAPFFAVPIYPLTRKSMGGIQVDLSCRVLTDSGETVPSLYACGEATGFGRINGKKSLEGTFIGAAILMGRVAARSIAEQVKPSGPLETIRKNPSSPRADQSLDPSCLQCHNLPLLTAEPRSGYWHFQKSHRIVQERNLSCSGCHAEMASFPPAVHKIDKLAQANNCITCHSTGDE